MRLSTAGLLLLITAATMTLFIEPGWHARGTAHANAVYMVQN